MTMYDVTKDEVTMAFLKRCAAPTGYVPRPPDCSVGPRGVWLVGNGLIILDIMYQVYRITPKGLALLRTVGREAWY